MSQAFIPKEDAKAVLGIIAHTIKETLGTEQIFIIKVILQEEWLDKKLEGSAHGSYVYLSRLFSEEHLPEDMQAEALDLSLMTNSIKYIWTKRTWLESHKGAVHPSFEQDKTKDHFHDFLNIQSLLWYPFFFNSNGCYVIALNQISNKRSWRKEEIQFLESVTNLGELALQKSYLYAEHIRQRQENSRLDRLNLVGQLAASIGHEVRNPMTTVRGFLQLLSKQQKNCADMGSHFKLMIEELDRVKQIITDFLQLAKNPVEQFNLQSLNDILALRPCQK